MIAVGLRFYCDNDDWGGECSFRGWQRLPKRTKARRRGSGGFSYSSRLLRCRSFLLGIIVKFAQYSSVAGVFESLGGSDN